MHETKELVRFAEFLFDKNGGLLPFERIGAVYATKHEIPMRDALDLVYRRWRSMQKRMRQRDHRVLTVTTWYGLKLGLEGIAALTTDAEIKRCVPGAGSPDRAEGFVLASDDQHVLFIAECVRLGLVAAGVRRTLGTQLADATVQGIVSTKEAGTILAKQPPPLAVGDLRRLGTDVQP